MRVESIPLVSISGKPDAQGNGSQGGARCEDRHVVRDKEQCVGPIGFT